MSIIAISRGTFSGGEALAKEGSERLGYRCLGREENLEATTKKYRVSPEEFAAAMEKRPPSGAGARRARRLPHHRARDPVRAVRR